MFGLIAAVATAGAEPADPWQALVEMRNREALPLFEAAAGEEPVERLGLALARLAAQPRTRATLDRAQADLARLAAEDPGGDVGIRARYYLGRIAQIHGYEPDFALAARYYEALVNEHPGHVYGQLAAVRLALVWLYGPAAPEERARHLARLERLGDHIHHPLAYRDYHYILGVALLQPPAALERALAHLVKAEQAGLQQARTRATVYIRIAELARLTGDAALAREYYERFRAEFPREARGALVERRLADLAAGERAP